MTHPCYRHPTWRIVRQQVLIRDRWLCRIGLPGCTTRATCVDHIIELDRGGPWFAPSNLRASCSHCNGVRAANQTNGKTYTPSRDW